MKGIQFVQNFPYGYLINILHYIHYHLLYYFLYFHLLYLMLNFDKKLFVPANQLEPLKVYLIEEYLLSLY